MPFVENAECASRFAGDNLPIYETYLCAGGEKKIDTCHGDSGGPIQTYAEVNKKSKMALYGVVSGYMKINQKLLVTSKNLFSAGIQCLNPGVIYPGIYTNIAHYLTWILDNMSP